MTETQTLEVPISGMDCAECSEHVRHAIAGLPGVAAVDVFLSSEKAVVRLDPTQVNLDALRRAVEDAGYRVPPPPSTPSSAAIEAAGRSLTRQLSALLAALFGVVLVVVIGGEWLGLFERVTERMPWPIWLALTLIGGYPVFRNVVRAALRRQILSHTLMTLGVIAAIAVGQWATALVVVFFMRVGEAVERFTAERARGSLRSLTALAPQTARVERAGIETAIPAAELRAGDVIIVRPGERIPADGTVLDGHATIDRSAITGEALPVEAGRGSYVYAATIPQLGSLRVQVTGVGSDTTFGRVIKLVEEAEANRADVQRIADKFSAWYLPAVLGIAALTLLLRRDPLATAAVLVVACSCSFALATPIAMLASVGAAARRGLLIKGGRYLELLARADVLLVDKTGTVTLGKPRITGVTAASGFRLPASSLETENREPETELLRLAASAERYSEHPLAAAVRAAAAARGIALAEPRDFRAIPGLGVQAVMDGVTVTVGSQEFVDPEDENAKTQRRKEVIPSLDAGLVAPSHPSESARPLAEPTRGNTVRGAQDSDHPNSGQTLIYVAVNGQLAGILTAADTRRTEVPAALAAVRSLGIKHIELLTGDNEHAAAALASDLGIAFQANLLPEDKIRIVKEYQAAGHVVVMMGDGVNDAPALAQAHVGIAMGAAGSDVAIEASDVALMRDDWTLVPDLFRIARRTLRIVRMNLGFTAAYNIVGLTLAALGILPPILAAAAQSLPDLGILGNSSRLLRQK